MTVARKQQILVKKEPNRGVNANPGAADAVLVYEPEIEEETEFQSRVPAGPSLSRAAEPIGLEGRVNTFRSDFRGSGDTTNPVDEPEWGKLITAGGFRKLTPKLIPITAIAGPGYHLGEKVSKDASNWGVVIKPLAVNGDLLVVEVQGTITTGGTLTGARSGTTGTIGTVNATPGALAYAPASDRLVTLAVASWTGGSPVVGDVALVTRGVVPADVPIGSVRIVKDNGSMTSFDVEPLYIEPGTGGFASGDHLTVGGTKTADLNAAPVAKQIESVTVRANKGGYARDTVGAFGSFECSGEAGGVMEFSWNFRGQKGARADRLPEVTGALSSISPPRLLGAHVGVSVGADGAAQFYRVPVKALSYVSGVQVVQDENANADSGTDGGEITDRDPEIRVTVNALGSTIDWHGLQTAGTLIPFGAQLGSTPGNIVGLIGPQCQVTEVRDGERNGIATYEVVLKPRRQLEAGDDEVYFFQR